MMRDYTEPFEPGQMLWMCDKFYEEGVLLRYCGMNWGNGKTINGHESKDWCRLVAEGNEYPFFRLEEELHPTREAALAYYQKQLQEVTDA